MPTRVKHVKDSKGIPYEVPLGAVIGWNDTGEEEDSPCSTDVGIAEANRVAQLLDEHHIPFRFFTSPSSNPYMVRHFFYVAMRNIKRARRIINIWYDNIGKESTTLLYIP